MPDTIKPNIKVIVERIYINLGFFSAVDPNTAPDIPKKKIAKLNEISA